MRLAVVVTCFMVSAALAAPAPARRQPEQTVLIKIHNPFGDLGSGNFHAVHCRLDELDEANGWEIILYGESNTQDSLYIRYGENDVVPDKNPKILFLVEYFISKDQSETEPLLSALKATIEGSLLQSQLQDQIQTADVAFRHMVQFNADFRFSTHHKTGN